MDMEIGKAAQEALGAVVISAEPSRKLSTVGRMVRRPETRQEAFSLKIWATEQPEEVEQPATAVQLAKFFKAMADALPSQGIDEAGAENRAVIYARLLGGYSAAALSFMVTEVLKRNKWFPVPSECLSILAEYRTPEAQASIALGLCRDFWQEEFGRYIDALREGTATIESVMDGPEKWRMIAMERGYLRWLPDEDRWIIRPRKVYDDGV